MAQYNISLLKEYTLYKYRLKKSKNLQKQLNKFTILKKKPLSKILHIQR